MNPDMEPQMAPLILDRESLYITLNGLDNDETRSHWGFYLWKGLAVKSGDIGKYFHVTDRKSTHEFSYEETHSPDIRRVINVFVVLKMAIIKPVHWNRLGQLLSRVPIHASTTCRTWVLEALKVLGEERIVRLKDVGIRSIEEECLNYAGNGRRIIRQSNHCKL